MSVGLTAGVTAALIGAGGAVASGVIGSNAANSAASKIAAGQAQGAQDITNLTGQAVQAGQSDISNANTYLQGQGDKAAAQYAPFTAGTGQDLQQLQDLAGPNGALSNQFSFNQQDFENTPAYKIILDRGEQAIQRSAAAQGGLFSTNTLKNLNQYATDTTNTQFNDAYNRALAGFQANRAAVGQRVGTLQSLASLGLQGAQGTSGAIGQTASQVNQNMLTSAGMGLQGAQIIGNAQAGAAAGAANAQAAGGVGSANSWLSALKQGGNALQTFLTQRAYSGGGSTVSPSATNLSTQDLYANGG